MSKDMEREADGDEVVHRITLSGISPELQKRVDEFMADFCKLGMILNYPEQRFIDGVVVHIREFRGTILLQHIVNVSTYPGKGTVVMHKLVELADKHQLTMALVAKPMAKPNQSDKIMTKVKLRNWYKSFGFKYNRVTDIMTRKCEIPSV